MLNYTNQLQSANSDTLSVNLEVAKITSIHQTCGLAQAESSISQTLSPSGSKPPQQPGPAPALAVPGDVGGKTTGTAPGGVLSF